MNQRRFSPRRGRLPAWGKACPSEGEPQMNRFFAFIATGTLISLLTIISACTTASVDQTSSISGGYYQESRP
ncbi:hypothetical protein AMK01_CH03065 [Rhizobium sp. N6212]|nr:hypothetical protein AMK01_CH03065 [Rhizobium sp. N6212]ANK98538.1 hypothetical protein AMK00_CH03068 [Rhizobium sp. N621]ANL22782.1 hypothetical protein AMJ96_CH03098 [Rhizobium sp. N113]ANM35461.1 hypothetical protein AMK04_CH03098 [Rhizobium sp. N871]ANM41573.1 hypothetical protein AMK03_CH03098 [Rhizobium sp. N741]